jgi:hypothetical protein
MRSKFAGILVPVVVIILGVFVFAGTNPMGISDSYKITFSEPVRVADTLLPRGDYEIRHVMEGETHIMVFHQLRTSKPVEVRAKCSLIPLTAKAPDSQKIYELNAANERVLHELIFKGDRAKHVF